MKQNPSKSYYTVYLNLLALGLFAVIIAFLVGISPIAAKMSLADPPSPMLQISKTAKPDPVAPGGLLTYTLAVTNTGDALARVLVITDTVPVSTTYRSSDGTYLDDREVLWVEGPLEINRSITKTFTVRVNADGFANDGFIRNDEYGVECTEIPIVTIGTPITTSVRLADLAISKTGPPLRSPGERIAYQITYTNTGGVAENVVITDTLPAEVEYESSSLEPALQEDRMVVWNVGAVESGSHTIVLTGTVSNTISSPITITNQVTVTTSVLATSTDNNSSSCETRVLPLADLAISKTGPPLRSPGERIAYQITYTNTGGVAENVVITDTLPAEVEYENSSLEPEVHGQELTWNVGAIESGPHTIVLTGTVSNTISSPITITNQVTVTTSVLETSTDNNYGSYDTRVLVTVTRKIYLPIILKNHRPLCNGGFETGDFTCWEHDDEDLPESIVGSAYAHSGSYAVLLGDSSYCNAPNPNEPGNRIAWISQTFYVPSTGELKLTFWYRIQTYDHIKWTDGTLGDSFDFYLNDSLIWRDNYDNFPYPSPGCDSRQDLGWKWSTYDLTPFQGQEITLRFENVTRVDGWYNTWTYVDGVQIQ